jgi:hypothetical protein
MCCDVIFEVQGSAGDGRPYADQVGFGEAFVKKLEQEASCKRLQMSHPQWT